MLASIGTVVLLVGLRYPIRLLAQTGPSRVVQCDTHWSHGAHASVRLEDGSRLDLTWEDIREPERCIPRGTRVEKRRGEVDYRVAEVRHAWENAVTMLLFCVLGVVFVLAGVTMARKGRRSESEALKAR